MTIPTQRVLAALLGDPERELYGMEIGEAAELRSGTVRPILARLGGVGWLAALGPTRARVAARSCPGAGIPLGF